MSWRPARRARAIAVACGLLAAALATAPNATAQGSSQSTAPDGVSATQLAAARTAVLRADVAGTAWYTDTATGTLALTADSTVGHADIARIENAVHEAVEAARPTRSTTEKTSEHANRSTAPAHSSTDVLRVHHTSGILAEHVAGGDIITGPGGVRCTVGFNVEDGSGTKYALTAGHCTTQGDTWSIGSAVSSSFPGDDYALIRYTDPSEAEGGVRGPNGTLIDIVDAGTPPVGEEVCATGNTTGVHCGTVVGLNATVNYGSGDIVSGLIETNLCSETGDSGGPLYSGHTAYGITSGGSGDCISGGETLYQPVLEPLNAYGVTIF